MAKLISVASLGKVATAGVLVVAGAAVNRLFRPFGTTTARAEPVEAFPASIRAVSPRKPLDALLSEPARTVQTARPTRPTLPTPSTPSTLPTPSTPSTLPTPSTPSTLPALPTPPALSTPPARPTRPARPASAVLARRGGSRKAWRCV